MTFATALREAMTRRKVGATELASDVNLTRHTIWAYLRTGKIPTLRIADALAEALDAPVLARMSMRHYSRRCVLCHARFYVDDKNAFRRRFCTKRCLRAAYNERRRGQRRDVAFAEAEALRKAVANHCKWCEPSGRCRDSACSLRGVSPLPLIALTRRVA